MARLLRTGCAARLLPLLLLLALPAAVRAQFTFTINNGTVTITGYTGSGGVVTIPSTTNGYPVTNIGNKAFQYCYSLTNVMIPTSVTNIGNFAFQYCVNLTSVMIGTNVDSIDGGAFYNWSSPPPTIGNNAFQFCYNLTGVIFGTSVTSIGDCAFYRCCSLTNFTIPNSVTNIGIQTFALCTNLTSVTIPNSVISLGSSAFYDCSSLTSVVIGTNVTSIGQQTFFGCQSLTSVTIPNSVISIGNQAFYDCSSLTNFTIPNSVTNIGIQTFVLCTNLTSVTIPNSVISLGSSAFYDCSSLTSVVIGTNVTSIGQQTFFGCQSLTSVTIPNSVTSIGWKAFNNCASLSAITVDPLNPVYSSTEDGVLFNKDQTMLIQYPTSKTGSYTIPDSVTNIEAAFTYCSLTNITIGRSVTNIAGGVFNYCTSLTAITVDPLNLVYTSSEDGVLFNQDQTTLIIYPAGKAGTYTIPTGVTTIGSSAFFSCTKLTRVTIPNSVTNIGGGAFCNCTGLTCATIANSVTAIGDWAFENCTSLTGVYFYGNAPSGSGNVFGGANNVIVYYLPETTGWGVNFGGFPTALWLPQVQTSGGSFGVETNQFGFNINWASGQTVVVEACTDLANPVWQPVETNALTSGSSYFSDSQWTNYPSRFYRIRSP